MVRCGINYPAILLKGIEEQLVVLKAIPEGGACFKIKLTPSAAYQGHVAEHKNLHSFHAQG